MVSKSSSGTFATLGSNIGSETKTLSVDNLPSHNHTFTGSSHTHSIPAHNHGLNSHTHTYSKSSTTTGSHTLTIDQIPSHRHKFTLAYGGNDPVKGFNYGNTIAGVFGIEDDFDFIGSTGGGKGHTHSITLTSTNTGAASGNTANSSALTSGGTTQGGTIGNTGKGTALSVVQNSKVCIRWHRIS